MALIFVLQNYPASNLINESTKKWKCEESGLESVYVVLQLENPTKINGIDIGNENSAFVEVAVGRTGWPVEKFKVCVFGQKCDLFIFQDQCKSTFSFSCRQFW